MGDSKKPILYNLTKYDESKKTEDAYVFTLDKFMREKARNELNEWDEVRTTRLREFRAMVKENKGTGYFQQILIQDLMDL